MAFVIPQHEFDQLRKLISENFPASQHKQVYKLVEPLTKDGTRVAKYVVQLSQGNIGQVEYYVDCARKDYRDVIFWAENPEEAAINTPEKIEDFQATLEWLDEPRDIELDEAKEKMIAERQTLTTMQINRRPWWRFW